MKTSPTGSGQRGMVLIEALIAILLFSVGILGLVGLQATAINLSTDAKERADAAFLANQLVGRLAIADPAAASEFAHHPEGTTACAPTGSASTNAAVTGWLREVSAALPGATSAKQQVTVDTSNNLVVVTLCWQRNNGTQHRHTVTTQMQWQ